MRLPIYIPFVAILVIAGHAFVFHVILRSGDNDDEKSEKKETVQRVAAPVEESQQNPLLINTGKPEEINEAEEEYDIADLENASEETYEPKEEISVEPAEYEPRSAVETALMMRKENDVVAREKPEAETNVELEKEEQEPVVVDMPAIHRPESEKLEEETPSESRKPHKVRAIIPVQGIVSH